MSDNTWQGYVDDQLIAVGLANAAIIGLDGFAWATSAGFQLRAAEGQKLVSMFSNPSDAFTAGITVGDIKYLTLRSDERSIYGKKGAGGIICVKTAKTVIIGVYNETLPPGTAVSTVEKLADFLLENSC